VADAEADFTRTAESFIETPPRNKDEVLSVMQRKIKTKSELSENLRKRLRNYQTRRDQRK
jgi:hypothetical protein